MPIIMMKYEAKLMWPFNIEYFLFLLDQYMFEGTATVIEEIEASIRTLLKDQFYILDRLVNVEWDVSKHDLIHEFIQYLPIIKSKVEKDVYATYQGDPAAKSQQEIQLFYPGIQALKAHRYAHFFEQRMLPLFPRAISEFIHSKTGIDQVQFK